MCVTSTALPNFFQHSWRVFHDTHSSYLSRGQTNVISKWMSFYITTPSVHSPIFFLTFRPLTSWKYIINGTKVNTTKFKPQTSLLKPVNRFIFAVAQSFQFVSCPHEIKQNVVLLSMKTQKEKKKYVLFFIFSVRPTKLKFSAWRNPVVELHLLARKWYF